MQRLSAWARGIALGFFTLFILPLVGKVLDHMAENYGLYDREALPNIINAFVSLAEQTWLRITVLVLGGFVAGLWVDWLLRRLDRSRAEARENLGLEMRSLRTRIYQDVQLDVRFVWPDSMQPYRAQLMSVFLKAERFGLWAPHDRIFKVKDAFPVLMNYLDIVGQMLSDGHFNQAKKLALDAKRAIDKEQSR
jgi:hypothetical protein